MTDQSHGPGIHVLVYPSNLVSASRIGKIASSLQSHIDFDETHLVGVSGPDLPDVEPIAESVTIRRLRGSSRQRALGQFLRFALWQPRVYQRYRKARIAVVAAHNIWVLPMCWLLARRTGAALAYNCHELETETGTMYGLKQVVARCIESWIITRCDVVSVVNESIADWYESRYAIPRPVVVGNVPFVRDVATNLRERLGVRPDEMLYIHTGNLAVGRNIPLILSAFAASPHHVVFLGDGPMRQLILDVGASHPNVHWHPPVDPDLVVAYVREADVGLCLIDLGYSLSARLSSPNKLMEPLAAKTPPLCSDLAEARNLLGALADQWILEDPERELAGRIATISKSDVSQFRADWHADLSWDADVAPLASAYEKLTRHEARPLRIAYVSSAHQWSDNRVHLREAASLASAGHFVTLVAVEHETEVPATGVRVVTIPQRSRLSRVLVGGGEAVLRALATRPEVIHLHDPELIWSIPFLRALGRKVVYDAHEDLPSQVLDKYYLSSGLSKVLAVFARLAVWVAGRSTAVVAATETIAATYPTAKTHVVHNYPRLRPEDAAAELSERPHVVGYIGAMSKQRGAVEMVDAFASSKFPGDWHAVVAGSTAPSSLLPTLESRPGWARVDYRGVLSPGDARDVLNECRVGLVLFQRNRAHVDSLPTKMFEYLAAGIPVIASDFELWRSILGTHECGLLVDETDPDAIAAAVALYASDEDLLLKHGANARRAAREVLNWDSEEKVLLDLYETLT
jgi:glycosyltransferase involved in cell wall biosynthesis